MEKNTRDGNFTNGSLKNMTETWCVFGSHGYLGGRLLEHLEALGHKVIRGDRKGKVEPGVDCVVNCQSYGNYYWQENIEEIFKANLFNLTKTLESVHGVRAFVYISSSSVLLPQQTFYSLAKQAGELACLQWGGPVKILRPSSITGPGEQPDHLIPKLIDACFTRKDMPFIGEPTHDFIDVRDVVSAIEILAKDGEKLTVNVSSGISISNDGVLAVVEDCTGLCANIKRKKGIMRSYDTPNWKVDNSEMVKLGWKPKYTLKDSIKEMVMIYDKS